MRNLKYMGAIVAMVGLCGCASDPIAAVPGYSSALGGYAVFFGHDKADIDPAAATTIRQAAEGFKAGRFTSVAVIGHTDTTGTGSHNQTLSECRAAAARAELIKDGVPVERILTAGAGETAPHVQTWDMTTEENNRRVMIVFQ